MAFLDESGVTEMTSDIKALTDAAYPTKSQFNTLNSTVSGHTTTIGNHTTMLNGIYLGYSSITGVTLSSGTQSSPATKNVTLTNIPSGKTPYLILGITLGGYPLPYEDPNTRTFVSAFNTSTKVVTLKNIGAAWNASGGYRLNVITACW